MNRHLPTPDAPPRRQESRGTRLRRGVVLALTLMLFAPFVGATTPTSVLADQTPGQGFTVSAADIDYILDQIVIAEKHSAAKACFDREAEPGGLACTAPELAAIDPSLVGLTYDRLKDPNLCAALRRLVGNPLLSFGLRTTDGSCNNLQPGQETYGAADQPFPRLTTPVFPAAENSPPQFGPSHPTSYNSTSGSVFDSEPRTISNIIVDQTSTNPAAICASQFPTRAQGIGAACDLNAVTDVPPFESLPIDNITTDVGLSPPFNSLFTIFGQFFDHGLDKITNGGNGTVFVPLKDDDPLVAGPDHIFGNSDDLDPNLRFMVLTRGTIKNNADGVRSAPNTDTPFVDQSQTYTSHSSHQLFLREYVNNAFGKPVSTGQFLGTSDGGMATWAQIKDQAANMLGLLLNDGNVGNIPLMATDAYGNFIPGPARGLPQYVTGSGLVEGNTLAPVAVPANAFFIDTAFLNDIAHSAAPTVHLDCSTLPPGPPSPCLPHGDPAIGTLFPDTDTVAGTSLDATTPAGSYDNELLEAHYICGDGRCNENIALTAIHQVFHDEHDRLIDDIKNTILTDTTGTLKISDWTTADGDPRDPNHVWNGARLFQAARFVTEMEYQHLVFEEFARKVQPLINPFQPFAFNQTDVNPAITAEYAHAVYRFGHSMLDDTIPRLNEDANGNLTHNDIPLLEGFLNPAAFVDDGNGGTLDARKAAGAIIMGLSDQTGQEIDEFVVDTLRNHLLGLPLDLPALNMTRARSEGIPTLNEVRRQIFASTNDGQLTPYTDWVDFGQNLKHPESLVNFIAAYGTHSSIRTLDPDGPGGVAPGSTQARRAAADQLVNGTVLPGPTSDPGDDILPPADAAEFMFGIDGATLGTDWSTTETGLNKIDLWVGGLAERTNLFGGLLGSTFNYVFENQLTNLQNGDRFYYLARTPGMNLRTQLEGNSFAELIMRNTSAHSLKADPFANADCKFELRNLVSPAPAGGTNIYFQGVGSVGDDPASACNENGVLIKMGDGTIRYRLNNPVNVPGINFQGVYNGRAGASNDRIYGGADNDTFWGGDGNDNIEGGDGADIALGGNGNDVITDLAGDDIPKGGPGNDAIDSGPGLDIVMAGDGNDFTNGGANINETFSGAGDDFAIAGAGEDAVFGDSGDDWEEGGDQPDLLIGDSSTLFFDDHNRPGNDILIGQGGDDDYDGEGGDDVFVTGPGVEKNAGASGYDWSIGVGDPQPQNADLALRIIVGAPPIVEVRDKFNEVEALSGWKFNDTLRGDDIVPSGVGGGGFIGCDALDAAGVNRIAGLDQLVPLSIRTENSADIALASATRFCLLEGPAWGAGNILLGGGGNDTMEGRGANDIIDGDRWMNVRLSVRTNPSDPNTEIGSTDLMENKAFPGGTFGPGTAGMTLQQAVFARKVEIGNIVAVRELLDANQGNLTPGDCDALAPVNCDTALFSAPFNEYTLVWNGDGSLTVSHQDGAGFDGTDTLWNIEQLSFCDTPGVRGVCAGTRSIVPNIPPEPAPIADLQIPLAASAFVAASGVPTAPETIVLTNLGNADLVVTGAAFLSGGDPAAFQITADTCDGLTLAPLEFCTVSVRFQSTAPGLLTGILNIPNNADGNAQAFLSGHVAAPIATITPLVLTGFTAQTGGASLEQTVTLTNSGDAPLTITGAAVIGGANPGDFSVTNNLCSGSLIPGASCTVGVTMTPGSGGAKAATLVLSHDATGDTTVLLDGFATQPIAIAAPSTLNFTGQVGVVGAIQQVTVTNAGDAPLTVSGSSLTGANAGEFTITGSNCGTVNPAGTCTVSVRFVPLTRGAKTAQLVIAHNGAGGSSTVNLAGTAVAPVITATTPTAFSSQVTVQTATKNVTVGNTGDANLTVGAVTLGGANPADFRIVTNGCTTVAPAGTCNIAVAFRPTATGTRTATLNIANNTGVTKVVNLTGTGLTPIPVMVVQATLAFPNTRINTTRTLTVRLTNNGPGTLNIGTLVVTGQFRVTRGNCGATLAVGRSCNLNVTFAPTTRGAKTGNLTVNSNAVGAPHVVRLTGTGI